MAYTLQELKYRLTTRLEEDTHTDHTCPRTQLKAELNALRSKCNRNDIHNIRDLEKKLLSLDTPPVRLPISDLCGSLVPQRPEFKEEQNIIYRKLFGSPVTTQLATDTTAQCTQCQCSYVYNQISAQRVCPSCGITTKTYQYLTDLEYIDELTRRQEYKRVPLYRRFLVLYNTDIPDIPRHVYEVILDHLFKNHTFRRSKCRPTPIIAILRKEKLTDYIPYALKMSRTLNSEPSNMYLPHDKIERLIQRFSEIMQVFDDTKKEKFLNYEFLTHQMLLMDRLTNYAQLFKCHKTECVYRRSMRRLETICTKLASIETIFEWFIPDQICSHMT